MPEITNSLTPPPKSGVGAAQTAHTLQAVLRLVELLNSKREVDDLLDILLQEGTRLAGAESGCAGVRTPAGMVGSRYLRRGTPAPLQYCWPPGHGLPGWLLLHKIPYLTNDVATDPQVVRELCREFDVRNALATPIIDAQGEVLGFFELHNKASGFTAADRDLLIAVAHAGALALGSALARRELEQAKTELQRVEGEVAIRIEQASRKSEERYRDLFENANDIVYTLDLNGNLTEINRKGEEILGYRHEDVLGKPIGALVAPEDLARMRKLLTRKVTGEQQTTYELRMAARDGQERTLEVSSRLLYHDGRPAGVHGIARDITVRKQMESELRTSRDQLQAIFDSIADGVMVQSASGTILFANETAARMCGYPSAEALLAAPVSEVLSRFRILDESGDPVPANRLPAQRAFAGEVAPTALVRWQTLGSGAEGWSVSQARRVLDEQGRVAFVVSAFQDVTALKQEETRARFLGEASALLAESLSYEVTLQQVAQLAAPVLADWAVVDLVDDSGNIQQLAVTHVDPEKVAWAIEFSRMYPPDPNARNGAPKVIRTGRAEFYPELDQAWLESLARNAEELAAIRCLGLRSAMVVPLIARGKTLGAITFAYAESGRHYRDADLQLAENLAHRAAMAVDNARLHRDAQDALRVREEFLSTISHDLRTPLTTIRGHAQLLQRQAGRVEIPPPSRLAASLAEIDRSSHLMERMIGDLLDLSRLESGRPMDLYRERVDLVQLTRRLAQEQQYLAARHRIVVEAPSQPINGIWDASRLERMLGNLLSNAVKYSPDGGEVSVSVTALDGESTEGRWVELRVCDQGVGIPPADLERIFERFHRSGNVGGRIQGLGIGLASAKQIVEQHGGAIAAESSDGTGSVFTVRLPCGDPDQ